MEYNFEKLRVWQKSKDLVKLIYQITSNFPSEEKFGLTSQLRRASVSISSNLAEGSTRKSQKEKGRFYEIAYGSLIEVLNQLIIANELRFCDEKEIIVVRSEIDDLVRMLSGQYKSTQPK